MNIVYIQCPSCSYKHGPITLENARGIVGCPQEKGSYVKDQMTHKMEYMPHRYGSFEMSNVKKQIAKA